MADNFSEEALQRQLSTVFLDGVFWGFSVRRSNSLSEMQREAQAAVGGQRERGRQALRDHHRTPGLDLNEFAN